MPRMKLEMNSGSNAQGALGREKIMSEGDILANAAIAGGITSLGGDWKRGVRTAGDAYFSYRRAKRGKEAKRLAELRADNVARVKHERSLEEIKYRQSTISGSKDSLMRHPNGKVVTNEQYENMNEADRSKLIRKEEYQSEATIRAQKKLDAYTKEQQPSKDFNMAKATFTKYITDNIMRAGGKSTGVTREKAAIIAEKTLGPGATPEDMRAEIDSIMASGGKSGISGMFSPKTATSLLSKISSAKSFEELEGVFSKTKGAEGLAPGEGQLAQAHESIMAVAQKVQNGTPAQQKSFIDNLKSSHGAGALPFFEGVVEEPESIDYLLERKKENMAMAWSGGKSPEERAAISEERKAARENSDEMDAAGSGLQDTDYVNKGIDYGKFLKSALGM